MRIPVLLAALFAVSFAAADASVPATVVEAQATQQAIVEKLKDDDYDHVQRGHREKIAEAQQALAALPQDGGPDDVANAQALVAEIDRLMADAELDRQVCHRERPLGSNRMVRVCRTKRQIAEQADRVRNNGPLRSAGGCGMEVCPGG
jgi:hypothetical protein